MVDLMAVLFLNCQNIKTKFQNQHCLKKKKK